MMDEKFGCVIFDDVHQHKTGWAVKMPDKRPVHITGVNELETEVVWITNLDYQASFNAGFSNHGKLRRSDYFRLNMEKSNAQFDLNEDLQNQAYFYAHLFEKTSQLASNIFGIDEINRNKLGNSFRSYAGVYDPIFTKDFANYFSDATANYIRTEQNKTDSASMSLVDLWIPALEHALSVLSTPLPAGEWKRINKRKIPKYNNIMNWLMEQTSPGILRVNIYDVDPMLSPLINYGSGSIGNSRRKWVTTTELLSLIPIANIEILDGYISQNTIFLDALIDILNVIPKESVLSLSAHYMLDSLWTGLTTAKVPPSMQKPQYKKNSGNYLSCNPITPFIRSYDRFCCLSYVLKMTQMGYNVHGYGSGLIRLDASNLTESDIYKISQQMGLIPPMMEVPNLKSIQFDDNSPQDYMLKLLGSNDLMGLLDLDSQIVEGLSQINTKKIVGEN